jgi:eukaryotic-like serine/threonine-protein kinase
MSSAVHATEAFLANIRGCGLLKTQHLEELETWARATHPDVRAVARELNRRAWLTAFQIKEIFKGHGRDLSLGRYVLLDLLGEGGMGRVYKAHDTRLGRDVALKIIRKEKLKHPAAETRFKHEIEALAKMRHPNVVQVFNADQVGDTHYYEMEFVDGADLTRLVKERGPLPVADACEYIRQAALGLQHAHEMGLVHRDIKPSNILVARSGRVVKLVDLGLARLMEHEPNAGRVTQEGFVIGTPDFLAPEQARDPASVDIRADIYALGGTLYYLLAARVPYDGANPTEKLVKHCTDPPPALLAVRPDAPPVLDQVIRWSMAKQPELRPQSPLQLAQALAPFSHNPAPGITIQIPIDPPLVVPSEPSSAVLFRLPPQATSADPIRRRAEKRFPWGYAIVALGGLVVAAILGYGLYLALLPKSEPPIDSFTTSERSGAIRLVKLDGGAIRMGSPETERGRKPDEGPTHEVTLTGPILIAAGEVSQSQYLKVMGMNPAKSAQNAHRAQQRPVEWVSWDDAAEFCKKLTELERGEPWARKGWAFRLPTEAEWEYAARAGSETPFAFGDQIIHERHALFRWSEDDPRGVLPTDRDPAKPPKPALFPLEIGKTEPNRFGLCDLHGNVAEWCLDWYRPIYPDSAVTNPIGPADGDRRVIRGGSFKTSATETRSAARSSARPDTRRDDVGFRVVYAPVGK